MTLTDYPFIQAIPFDVYLEDAYQGLYLTSHFLSDFRLCPLLYRQKLNGEVIIDDTAAFQIGRATHALVLGGQDAFDEEHLVSAGPINPKTGEPFGKLTKAYKDWAVTQTKKIILTNEFDFMSKLQEAVWAHPKAAELLDGCACEGVVRTEYLGENVQIRMDAFNPNLKAIIDLKTCDNLDFFTNDCFKYGYAEQMAFYRDVFKAASGGIDTTAWLIAVEKRIPYRCGVWQVSDEMLAQAGKANERAIEGLRSCREQDMWPTRYEEPRVLDVPTHM